MVVFYNSIGFLFWLVWVEFLLKSISPLELKYVYIGESFTNDYSED